MRPIFRATVAGLTAIVALLALYVGLLTLVSDWQFTREQFVDFWPYIVTLASGFGVQIALYFHLRDLVGGMHAHGKVVAASGTASTAAMVSCCTHYLVNLLPILGATGFAALVAQYQVELFWVGIAFNAAGLIYIGTKVASASKEHAKCLGAT